MYIYICMLDRKGLKRRGKFTTSLSPMTELKHAIGLAKLAYRDAEKESGPSPLRSKPLLRLY